MPLISLPFRSDTFSLNVTVSPGRTQLWFGINETGKALEAGPIATDAKWFAITTSGDGVKSYWLIDATYLRVAGRGAFASEKRTTVDKVAGD